MFKAPQSSGFPHERRIKMTLDELDETIKYHKEKYNEQKEKGCKKCALEHLQLMGWLIELRIYREYMRELL
jgi:hypothetical protein